MRIVIFFSAAVAIIFAGCATAPLDGTGSTVDFSKSIKPILKERCVMCHNRKTMPERTSYESRELAMAGDRQGPVIIPGNPNGSRLITAISIPDAHEQAMPPVSHRVSAREIDLLKQWISEGAAWPSGPEGTITPTEFPLE